MLYYYLPFIQQWTGYFFGCANYRRTGCRFTLPFGPPHDNDAKTRLQGLEQAKQQAHIARRAEEDSIRDRYHFFPRGLPT
jgi:hypothetical protein